jgi:hypothetical protein
MEGQGWRGFKYNLMGIKNAMLRDRLDSKKILLEAKVHNWL